MGYVFIKRHWRPTRTCLQPLPPSRQSSNKYWRVIESPSIVKNVIHVDPPLGIKDLFFFLSHTNQIEDSDTKFQINPDISRLIKHRCRSWHEKKKSITLYDWQMPSVDIIQFCSSTALNVKVWKISECAGTKWKEITFSDGCCYWMCGLADWLSVGGSIFRPPSHLHPSSPELIRSIQPPLQLHQTTDMGEPDHTYRILINSISLEANHRHMQPLSNPRLFFYWLKFPVQSFNVSNEFPIEL